MDPDQQPQAPDVDPEALGDVDPWHVANAPEDDDPPMSAGALAEDELGAPEAAEASTDVDGAED